MSRVAVTVYNSMFEFWRKRRPDITLLLLSSRVVSIIRQVLNKQTTIPKTLLRPPQGYHNQHNIS
jgi:hypothetical protein